MSNNNKNKLESFIGSITSFALGYGACWGHNNTVFGIPGDTFTATIVYIVFIFCLQFSIGFTKGVISAISKRASFDL